MNSPTVKRIIKKLADEYGYSQEEIKEMVSYQFKFLRNVIAYASKKKLNYKTFRLRNIGAFYVPAGRIKQQRNFYGTEEDFSSGRSKQ